MGILALGESEQELRIRENNFFIKASIQCPTSVWAMSQAWDPFDAPDYLAIVPEKYRVMIENSKHVDTAAERD